MASTSLTTPSLYTDPFHLKAMPGWYDTSIHAAIVTNDGYTWLSAECKLPDETWKSSKLLLDTHVRADLPNNKLKSSSRWGGFTLHCRDIQLDAYWLRAVGNQSGKRTVLDLNKIISNSGGELVWDSGCVCRPL